MCWTLKSCRDSVEAEQFISEYEPEMRVRAAVAAILDVGGHPTDYDVVVTSPFAKGRQLRTEEEVKGRPFEQAENENIKHCRPPQSKASVHLVPLAFDVYGTLGKKADKALTEAGRWRPAKKYALVATRNSGGLGTVSNKWRAVAVQRRNFEVYCDCLSGIDEDDQQHEGELSDFVAVAKGMQ